MYWSGSTFRCRRPYVTEKFRRKILNSLHGLGHTSHRATKPLINSRFVWHKMNTDIANWCRYCGVLGWLLVVVLFTAIWGGSLGFCSVCWMLCTALYGSTSLQQSSKGSCILLVSGYNLRADCQWRTLVPPLNSRANAAPASVLALI